MIRTVTYNGNELSYELTLKNVKNINLRIKPNATVFVSANRGIPLKIIDEFVLSRADFITKALKNYKDKSEQVNKKYFNEDEIKDVILKLCKNIYPYFESRGIEHPKIKFRKMVSRWGSCNITKKVLTFNINLMYAPAGCIEYVVLHEFTHFLQPNHSSKFYEELEKICPDWKKWRKCLKEINLYENM
ncbi:MAG: DUF45 domain-containing protein [Clostridia bacterium]|nr:DUF45 domain-containing protein [Clostridia bacterium]